MQHQDGLISRREPLAGGLEVTGQDIPLIHPLVSEEAIRSLGIRIQLRGGSLKATARRQRREPLSSGRSFGHEATRQSAWVAMRRFSRPPSR
jgi:hypothetical protein